MNGNEGLLLYTLDMDNDLTTSEDREVFYRSFNGSAWSPAVRMTDNGIEDSAPKATRVDGDWFVIWHQNGSAVYKTSLGGDILTDEFLSKVPADYETAVMEGENPQIAIVYGNADENNSSLSAAFYDINKGVWSDVLSLCDNAGYIGSFSPVFTDEGKLNAAYTRAEIIKQVIDDTEFMLPGDKVDLMMLSYTPLHDLAVDELRTEPAIPVAGAQSRISAVIKNNGDFAENATLSVYDGEPGEGRLIGEITTEEPVPARGEAELELTWQVAPEEREMYRLNAVVSTDNGVHDADESSNSKTLEIITADIAVTDVKCENTEGNNYLAGVSVVNAGGRALENITLQLKHVPSGEVLETKTIESMMDGQEIRLDFMFSSNGLAANQNGETEMAVNALLPAGTQEFSGENNTFGFTIKPASVSAERMDPAPGSDRVSIDKAITIGFNMNVGEGTGFDGIELIDENLNEIGIDKAIEENTLTITPRSPLGKGINYTLTIPADAVSSAYGHKMDEPISLSFLTTVSNPEIIFSYPGDGMTDIEADSEIKVRYNQNINQGPDFAKIALYQSDNTKVAASGVIDGEWLYILPAGRLRPDAAYTVLIPPGAAQNAESELQHENHEFIFTTKESGSGGGGGGGYIGSSSGAGKQETRDEQDTVPVDILPQSIPDNQTSVTVDLTNQVKDNGVIRINLTGDALKKLIDNNAGLTVVTGKGDMDFPAALLSSIGSGDVSIELSGKTGEKPSVSLSLTRDGKPAVFNGDGNFFTVTIPYTPTEEELKNTESIIIRADGGSGTRIICDAGFDPENHTILFKADYFGRFAVDYSNVSFTDVVPSAWYNKAVKFIAARGITNGTGNGNFSPDSRLTRGQFITMLMRTYGMAPDENPADNFADAGDTYYTGYLAAAKRLGISRGVGDNRFAPERDITRQEMFTMLYNALKLSGKLPEAGSGKTISGFSDSGDIAPYAREAMEYFVGAGVVNGSDGRLMPTTFTTRAQMAQLLFNLLSVK